MSPSPSGSTLWESAVEAPPEDVWPWIAQLGQGRGGFYTYQTLENIVGCKVTNTTKILPHHQCPTVGEGIHLYEGGPPLEIKVVEPPSALVLLGSAADLDGGTTWGTSTWQFVVTPSADGGSRLLTRSRYDYGSGWKSRLTFGRFPLEPISFVMSRRMMLEIKRLAELRSAPWIDLEPSGSEHPQRKEKDR